MSDDNTRDIAVEAKTKVDGHIDDCVRFRQVLDKRMTDFTTELKSVNKWIAIVTGIGIALNKGIDGLIHLIGH